CQAMTTSIITALLAALDSAPMTLSNAAASDNTLLARTAAASTAVPLAKVGTAGNDVLVGTDRADILYGQDGDDFISGGAGDDLISGGRGNDTIDGGAGIDTAGYSGRRSHFSVAQDSGKTIVRDKVGLEGTDILIGVERLLFSDTSVALDLDGHAGMAVKVLGAVLGREAVHDKSLVGVSLGLFDAGLSSGAVATVLIEATLGAAISDEAFVAKVYHNITGVAPSDADLAYYVALLKSGVHTQASLVLLAAETEANKVNIDLVGLSHTGVEFTPGG
ncbi:MAG: DUF4214 domain-containing protein, partial [Burkholderiaceae bacterium]|nr:DUF4214 domain-containing protein [Burkholderiaceae bacterium]